VAHPQQRAFLERAAALHPARGPLLEIGSLDVNGSVRDLFPGAAPYVGVDLHRGRGVDVVASGHDFGRDATFDTVVTTECLEHDPGWHLTLRNIVRVLQPGGTLLLTCATTGRHEHGTTRTSPAMSPSTNDHYRNLTARDVLAHLDGLRVDLVATCWTSFDLYVVARKPPAPPPHPALVALAARYRRDATRPSRVAERALLRAFRTDQMDGVPLWAGLLAHPLRAVALGVALLREADPPGRRARS
jgi:SAM-dependent methyltransferase